MLLQRAATLLVCSLCLVPLAHGDSKTWTEVTSPHFRVITDAGAGDARKVAKDFEQLRDLFEVRFPGFTLDNAAPLLIVAARDLDTAKQVEPLLFKHSDKIAGEFHRGWEKQFALVRLDLGGQGAGVAFFDYTQSILLMNARYLPTWLSLGLGEFYASTQFRPNKTYIGAPERFSALRSSLLPVETLLAVDQRSPYYRDPELVEIFQADSWALIHYLTFGPGMQSGNLLNQFYNLIEQGHPQRQAFLQTFGDFKKFDKGWSLYMNNLAFSAGVVPAGKSIDEKSFAARKLTPGETELALGQYHIGSGDWATGETLIDAALHDDPGLAEAHEEKGFLLFQDGDLASAQKQFGAALTLDPTMFRSLFATTMMAREAAEGAAQREPADSSAGDAAFHANLQKVLRLNPKFAPASVALAELYIRKRDYPAALANARQAEALEPSRAGYHLLTGRILLAAGQASQAAQFATFVADRWTGPDRDEALELWDAVPAAQRPPGIVFGPEPGREAWQQQTGTLKATHCTPAAPGQPRQPYTLTLTTPDGERTFSRQGSLRTGFADTLWYGEDHFTSCHNLEGRRAVVYYKPASSPGVTGELMEFEIRDAAPAAGSAVAAAAVPAASPAASPSATPAGAASGSSPNK